MKRLEHRVVERVGREVLEWDTEGTELAHRVHGELNAGGSQTAATIFHE